MDAFLAPLRRAISCVTNVQLAGGWEPGGIHGLIVRPTTSGRIPLRADTPINLRLIHLYEVVDGEQSWSVHTVGYTYQFALTDGVEIVIYHYDPRPGSLVTRPHLHVRGLNQPMPLGKAHFPTGRVSIEETLRFAMRELGVQPLKADWVAILDTTEADFNTKRTW